MDVNGLIIGKPESLLADLCQILSEGDFSSFESFKEYWRENSLSLIHRSLVPKETRGEFYQFIWLSLLERLNEKPFEVLFTLTLVYLTSAPPRVPIRLDPELTDNLHSLACCHQVVSDLLFSLNSQDAFVYGLQNEPALPAKRRAKRPPIEFPATIELPATDCCRLEDLSSEYHFMKAQVCQQISAELVLFQRSQAVGSSLSGYFVPENTEILSLSDPLFIYKLEAEKEVVSSMRP